MKEQMTEFSFDYFLDEFSRFREAMGNKELMVSGRIGSAWKGFLYVAANTVTKNKKEEEIIERAIETNAIELNMRRCLVSAGSYKKGEAI